MLKATTQMTERLAMKLNIQTQNVQPNPLLMAFVRERMRHAMRHHSEEISSIDVYIKDANGPRGGEDKLVRVRAYFRNRASLVA